LLIPFVAIRFGWQAAFFTTGSFSMLWLVCWLLFPYNRLRLKYGQAAAALAETGIAPKQASFKSLLGNWNTWSFALSKASTDPVWWFYLYWLPKFFHERFGVNMAQIGLPIIIVYVGATAGSIGGGWLSEISMRRGRTLRSARRFAMSVCACFALVVILVPFAHQLWQAIALLCIATAAHQGFSSNLLSTPSDNFPSTSVASVAGIGAAVSSIGSGLAITMIGILWTHYSLLIFFIAGFAYWFTMLAFQRKATTSAPDEAAGATA
jgi:ACS family hexuronate transporter-like MFS transporter